MRIKNSLVNIALILLVGLASCNNETKPAEKENDSKAIKEQAELMGKLLLSKDFKSFAKYTYPKILDMLGGEEKMIATLENGSKEMEAQGMGILSVTVGEPSAIITAGKELQCTLPETLEMKVPNGKLKTKSTLIGISNDNGKNWYFIDTSGKDIKTLQQALPNLSGELVIPVQGQPTFTNE
jgi:hypothetical protein